MVPLEASRDSELSASVNSSEPEGWVSANLIPPFQLPNRDDGERSGQQRDAPTTFWLGLEKFPSGGRKIRGTRQGDKPGIA